MRPVTPSRLVLIAPSLAGGGAERVLSILAEGLARRGERVDLLLARAEGPYLAQVPSDVTVVDLGVDHASRALPGIVRYLRRARPTAALCTLSHMNLVAIVARALAGVRCRLVVREANTLSSDAVHARRRRGRWIAPLARLLYPRADAVVAPSRGVADDLVLRIGVPAERVRVIPNPTVTPDLVARAAATVDDPWFVAGGPPVVLGMGRLVPQKDFATLIRAFARVRAQRPARLVILGEGEERRALAELAEALGVASDVRMPGFVGDPFPLLARAGVFVLSSAWEGLPNALIQAMALGTPVVATDCPSGPREILDEGRLGGLVPVGEDTALAEAIVTALDAPVAPARLRAAVERFGAEPVVARYLRLLNGEPDA